jgi:TPR repeat protein
MKFKEKYQALLSAKRNSVGTLSAEAAAFANKLHLPDKWFEAMAVCESALDANAMDDSLLQLRIEMFMVGREIHAVASLDDDDYAQCFEQLVSFGEKLAAAGIGEATVELSSLYEHARYSYRDLQKSDEYMQQAVALGEPLALALYGYKLYYGFNGVEPDRERAIELLLEAKRRNLRRADLYLLFIDYSRTEVSDDYVRRVEEYLAADTSPIAPWHLLGDCYAERQDFARAISIYNKGIALDDPYCKYRKGMAVITGQSDDCSKAEALSLLKDASEWQMPGAADMLGQVYCFDPEFRNVELAVEWFKKGIRCYDSDAMLHLALLYLHDENGYRNRDEGLKYLDMAIAENNIRAMSKKADLMLQRGSPEYNVAQGKALLQHACDAGDGWAACRLGIAYQNAEFGGKPDSKTAMDCYLLAADRDNADALYRLGSMYKYGIDCPENPELAIEYFTRAAALGDIDAHVELGVSCELQYGGQAFDAEKIYRHIEYAAEQGHPFAQYKMGCYLYYGLLDKDKEQGLVWFRKSYDNGLPQAAIALGDHYLYSDDASYDRAFACYKAAEASDLVTEGLGLCYLYGLGVEQSAVEAFRCFSIAADSGYTNAKYHLALCYIYASGVERNCAEAARWLREAADEGNMHAAFQLGIMLLQGDGIPADPQKGLQWLREAAENDEDSAQYELGNCYLMGQTVNEDETTAMYWYGRAAENGNEKAQKIVGRRKKTT